MSQFNLETPSITASTTSGTELAADLSAWRTALHTSHSGATAPSYAAAGMLWYDSTNKLMKVYDGADSITALVVDATNNLAYPSTTNPKFQFPLTTGGALGQYNLTLSPALTAYVNGDTLTARINVTNTTAGGATLNVNGIAMADIRKVFGGTDVAVAAYDLVAGGRYMFTYDTAADGGSGAWIVVNPSTVRIESVVDVTLSSTEHPFQIGLTSSTNLAIDNNEIQVRNNGAASNLNISPLGGDVVLGSASTIVSLDGGQILFPSTANPSSNANTLDDYEEGTWTPLLRFGGNGAGMTHATQNGFYVKIGQSVTIWYEILLSAKGSSTGTSTITGIPFTALGSQIHGGTVGLCGGMTAGSGDLSCYVSNAGTAVTITVAGSTSTGMGAETDFTSTSRIIGAVTYRAA